MNRKIVYPILILVAAMLFYYGEREKDKTEVEAVKKNTTVFTSEEFDSSLLPTSTTGQIVNHKYYTLSYSEPNEQAEWVAYPLLQKELSKNEFDRPYFVEDAAVKTKSADWRDYKNSGYDKGHLCPAGDRRINFEAYTETFLTSNISPQNKEFNSGIWNRLEQKVRFWAEKYNGVYVITGPILKTGLPKIGDEKVSVPEEFYKIVYDVTDGNQKVLGFIIPNKPSSQSFYEYVVPIDFIEQKTGINFFPNLSEKVQEKIESSVMLNEWGGK